MTEVLKPRIGITGFVPDLDTLDDYQLMVREQVSFDAEDGTIRGKQPLQYMHDGIVEETHEPWDKDRFNPGYSRMGSLLRELGETGQGDFFPGDMSGTAIELHRKEFGDISWYLANRLALNGIVMSAAVERGITARAREGLDFEPGFHAVFEDWSPGLMYMAYSSELVRASEAALSEPSDEVIEALAEKAGILILMMSQLVSERLDTSYEAILNQNIAKIKKRIADDTVFDKSGGDAR